MGLIVKTFSFLINTRSQELRFGRNLVGFVPISLPDLFKQLRDQNPKHTKKYEIQNFKTTLNGNPHEIIAWQLGGPV